MLVITINVYCLKKDKQRKKNNKSQRKYDNKDTTTIQYAQMTVSIDLTFDI